MGEQPREIRSRFARLRAYLVHNRDRMLVDFFVITAWIVATWSIFSVLGVPRWVFYLILFLGVIVYSQLTTPWSRPYLSPDLEEL